jgi:tetratricopeptide (TPR) repeat protein
MYSRLCRLAFFIFFIPGVHAQELNGLAGNAQMQREADARFFDGLKQLLLDKPEEAAKSFEKSLDINNQNAAAHFKLAEIQTDRNQIPEAIKHISEACKLEPKNPYYLGLLAELQEMSGDWKNAIKSWRKLGALPNQDPLETRLSVARIFIEQKKFKDAIEEINLCQKETGPTYDLFQFRISLHLKRNDLKAAIAEGETMLKTFPDDVNAWSSVCRLLLSNNKIQEAREKTIELLRRFPDYAAAHLILADIYLQEKNETAAFEEMQKAFTSPDLPSEAKIEILSGFLRAPMEPEDARQATELSDILLKIHPGEARVFIVRGDVLNMTGRNREARDMYLNAKRLDKNNFSLWEQLVLIDLNLNEIDSLVVHTTQARELFPNTPSFAFYNGLGLLMQKKYEGCVEALEHAARISPDNRSMQLEIFSQLGDAYYNLKNPEKSFSSYDEALALDSSSGHVLNNYSYFLSLEKTQLEKAVRMSSRLVQLFPEDPTYLDTHGWVLFQAGRYAESIEFLEKAARASGSGVIWEHYGDALYRNRRLAEAETAWKKALELGGGTSPELPAKIRDKKLN